MDDHLSQKIEYLKEQLSNQEKLASLGLLSAGIAHEIQNPLNFVINFSKLSVKLLQDMQDVIGEIKDDLSEESNEELEDIITDLQCNLLKILENGERASSIVKGILLYSRGNDSEFIPTDLKKIIKEYIWLSYHSIRANNNFNISIQENYQDVPAIPIVPQDVSRAVLNIMNNACYAVYRKSIQNNNYSPVVKIDLWQEGEYVKLSIEDNGTGIPEEVLPNLFQPFFTTKPVGEGTGLGLSVTKTIIEEKHQGKVEVETSSGEYTRFIISLPVNNHSV